MSRKIAILVLLSLVGSSFLVGGSSSVSAQQVGEASPQPKDEPAKRKPTKGSTKTEESRTPQPGEKRIFLIGNSLTWDTRPPLLDEFVQWHVDCGKSLQYIFDHPESPCVKSSVLWPQALKQQTYDYLCVQPHYGTTLAQDVDVISRWMAMQPDAVVVIHAGWARSASAAEEFAARGGEEMGHRRDYYARLIERLKRKFPDRSIRQTFSTDALHQVAEDIEDGKAPLQQLTDLYRDAIHMTHGEGRYLMHNLMRAAVDQDPSDAGFEIREKNPGLKNYLDRLVNSYDNR